LFTSCEERIVNRGYIHDDGVWDRVKVGDKSSEILTVVGTPTVRSPVKSANGGYSWFYISRKLKRTAFLQPKVMDQNMLVVNFNSKGEVESIKKMKLKQEKLTYTKNKTETTGKTGSVLEETFGGLGKYVKYYQDVEASKKVLKVKGG
jgi:outer membrane protein assembly factor BamE (lipoprotein component of BamABCDE complex)